MQNEGLPPPGKPALEASRVAAVKVRCLAAREQKLQESCLYCRAGCDSSDTLSPIWKGSTQTGQLLLFSSVTTLVSKAWGVEK